MLCRKAIKCPDKILRSPNLEVIGANFIVLFNSLESSERKEEITKVDINSNIDGGYV